MDVFLSCLKWVTLALVYVGLIFVVARCSGINGRR